MEKWFQELLRKEAAKAPLLILDPPAENPSVPPPQRETAAEKQAKPTQRAGAREGVQSMYRVDESCEKSLQNGEKKPQNDAGKEAPHTGTEQAKPTEERQSDENGDKGKEATEQVRLPWQVEEATEKEGAPAVSDTADAGKPDEKLQPPSGPEQPGFDPRSKELLDQIEALKKKVKNLESHRHNLEVEEEALKKEVRCIKKDVLSLDQEKKAAAAMANSKQEIIDLTNAFQRGFGAEANRTTQKTFDQMCASLEQIFAEQAKRESCVKDEIFRMFAEQNQRENDAKSKLYRGISKWQASLYQRELTPLATAYTNFSQILNRPYFAEARMSQQGSASADDKQLLYHTLKIFFDHDMKKALRALGLYAFTPKEGEPYDDVRHADGNGKNPTQATVTRCWVPGVYHQVNGDIEADDCEIIIRAVVELDTQKKEE